MLRHICLVSFMVCAAHGFLFADGQAGKPSKEEVVQKAQKMRMPFIANEGQADGQVKYYAKTFGGTVCVTKEGGIVYLLPKHEADAKKDLNCRDRSTGLCSLPEHGTAAASIFSAPQWALWSHNTWWQGISEKAPGNDSSVQQETHDTKLKGVALKEEFVGGRKCDIRGEMKSETMVSYFKGNDSSQWKTRIPTYEIATLGEVYKGIELRLKAHGNNVEKLFCVKPGASPEQIQIRLSGIQSPEIPPPTPASGRQPTVFLSAVDAPAGVSVTKGDDHKIPLNKGDEGVVLPGDKKVARGLWVNEHGELVAETALGPIKFTKPVAYQEIDGKRVNVECGYVIEEHGMQDEEYEETGPRITQKHTKEGFLSPFAVFRGLPEILNPRSENPKSEIKNLTWEYGFTVASYDKSHDLIIDPLLASTYLGGGQMDEFREEEGNAIAVDSGNNVFVTGYTEGALTNLPTTPGAYDISHNGAYDVFVSKFNNDLTSLLASTFLGGWRWDNGHSIAIDESNNVFVAGYTMSSDMPTTPGAYDTSYSDYGNEDVFVAKFSNDLTSLLACTFFGESGQDFGYAIALDSSNNVFVTGITSYPSSALTTPGAYDTTYNGGFYDAFVSKFSNDLTGLLASTFLGGDGYDYSYGIAIDGNDKVFVTGYVPPAGTALPTTVGAYDTSHNGGDDVFVSRFSNDLTNLEASTFLGGNSEDRGNALAVDSSNHVIVTGQTAGIGFPTTVGAYDTSHNDGLDVFVSRFSNDLTSLEASTFLGGQGEDRGYAIVVDSGNYILVTGRTQDHIYTVMPTTPGAYDTSHNGYEDVFIAKFGNDLTSLGASTFLGGNDYEDGRGIAMDSSNNIFVTGRTHSLDMPTTAGAYNTSPNGRADVFVSKLDNLTIYPEPTATPTTSPTPEITPTATPTATVTPTPYPAPCPGAQACYLFDEGSGNTAGDSSGNGHDGTINGAEWTTGKNGSGLSFDGIDDEVSLPVMNSDEVSVCAWFYKNANDTSGFDFIFGGLRTSVNSQLREGFGLKFFKNTPNRVGFVVITKNAAGRRIQRKASFDLGNAVGNWYHVAGVYNMATGEQKLYVNGQLVKTVRHPAGNAIVPLSHASDMKIGNNVTTNCYFHGIIDGICVYNRSLTEQEVLDIMNIFPVP